MVKLLIFLFALTVTPARVICPVDGTVVGWTGRTRTTNGVTECQYQHVWIHYRGSLLVDEPHVLWCKCKVEEVK
jgi:hypothetical protein